MISQRNTKHICIYKPLGLTPFQAIQEFRREHPDYLNQKIGYAGRLDPMAEGVLLCMVNEGNTERETYLNLDKEYEVSALIGVRTDSYDLLGMVESLSTKQISVEKVKEQLALLNEKTIQQPFPPFSAQPIDGIPLYKRTRLGLPYDPELIPVKRRTIHSCTYTGTSEITGHELLKELTIRINKVQGDFRQTDILSRWQEVLTGHEKDKFTLVQAVIHCSSGTFIRTLIHDLGKKIRTGACVFSLKRTKVGSYGLPDCIPF